MEGLTLLEVADRKPSRHRLGRAVWFGAAIALSSSCVGPLRSHASTRHALPRREADVYAAVLREIVPTLGSAPGTLLIADSTVNAGAARPEDVLDSWRKIREQRPEPYRIAAIPPDLASAFRAANASRRPLRGMIELARGDRRFLFASDVKADTVLVYTRSTSYYGARPYDRAMLSLSAIGFDQDGRYALVYVGSHCGSLCGLGQLLWLERTPAGWVRHDSLPLWVS